MISDSTEFVTKHVFDLTSPLSAMSAEGSAQAAAPAEEVPKASEATTASSTAAAAESEPAAPAGEKVKDTAPVEQSAVAAAPKEELAKPAEGSFP